MQRNRKVWPMHMKKEQATETACEREQMLDLTEKFFKLSTINVFTKLKESLIKEVKGCMMIINVTSNKHY